MGWGVSYALLRRQSRIRPLSAGIASGMSLSLLVDETASPLLGITPPNRAYPASAHLRGFIVHLVYGLTIAFTAEGLNRLLARRS